MTIDEAQDEARKAVGKAYRAGYEEGLRAGYREQAEDHHQWLLSHDEQIADAADHARTQALLEAADAWGSIAESDEINRLARDEYRAGGPSLPSIWLRHRAMRDGPTNHTREPETNDDDSTEETQGDAV